MVMCATGRKVPLEGFERRSLEAQVGICMDLKDFVGILKKKHTSAQAVQG